MRNNIETIKEVFIEVKDKGFNTTTENICVAIAVLSHKGLIDNNLFNESLRYLKAQKPSQVLHEEFYSYKYFKNGNNPYWWDMNDGNWAEIIDQKRKYLTKLIDLL